MATLYTVGHSTRSADAFLRLLRAHGVEALVDVRRHPGSHRHPHFARQALAGLLEGAGIAYRHEERLGGRRVSPAADSPNGAWRSASFRAYADHLNGPEGQDALRLLREEAGRRRTAVMCAEAVPWRCHRQLISDHLVAAGHQVVHLLDENRTRPHELRETARPRADGCVLYPPLQGRLL